MVFVFNFWRDGQREVCRNNIGKWINKPESPSNFQDRRQFSRLGSCKQAGFCALLDAAGRTEPWKVFWGCPIIGKSIATQDRALGHIIGPKLQIPFNVYGIMAITRPSIIVLLPLSLPVLHKHGSGYIQKDGFQNKCQHSERIWIAKNIGFLLPGS